MTTTEAAPAETITPSPLRYYTPAQVREEWARRLESGLYEQGRLRLHTGDRFCGLGVLADMAVEALGYVWRPVTDPRGGEHKRDFELAPAHSVRSWDACAVTVSEEVMQWAGIDRAHAVRVAGLNDQGHDFPSLAAYVRSI